MSSRKLTIIGFVFALSSMSTAKADIMEYMVTGPVQLGSTVDSQFGTIDLNTGVFVQIGPNETTQVAGLGETTATGSTVYASSYAAGVGILYTVNTATGALTQVGGSSNVDYYFFGSTLNGLYAVDIMGNLYSIDPGTGVPTLKGSLGITLNGFGNLSTNSSTLYFGIGSTR